jgi:Mg2+/citrate symporter
MRSPGMTVSVLLMSSNDAYWYNVDPVIAKHMQEQWKL